VHIRLIAIGGRQPAWVSEAFDNYAKRLPRSWRFRLDEVPAAGRGSAGAARAVEAEGQQVLRKLKPSERLMLLEEAGEPLSSKELAGRLRAWLSEGADLAFVIGGPDGVSDACRERAHFMWSLSRLTLPHALVRVVVAEQLYRAWTVIEGHPYHRD
jgi:23S rRNA (pseudouridine1915-N3)-methyltransferase